MLTWLIEIWIDMKKQNIFLSEYNCRPQLSFKK